MRKFSPWLESFLNSRDLMVDFVDCESDESANIIHGYTMNGNVRP
ncbi:MULTISPECIES: hypothetical protein [Grimontia]|nr:MULTISPECIES: hypothetical protein [Grimontia]